MGTLGGAGSLAASLNNRQQAVGSSRTRSGDIQAFLWAPGRGMRSLGTLGGRSAVPIGINTHRRVVGWSTTARGAVRATLWTPRPGPLAATAAEDGAEPAAVVAGSEPGGGMA